MNMRGKCVYMCVGGGGGEEGGLLYRCLEIKMSNKLMFLLCIIFVLPYTLEGLFGIIMETIV